MKIATLEQSTLVNDTCNDCGSYADIGAMIDENDTQLLLSFTGIEAHKKAKITAEKAKNRFDNVTSEIKSEGEIFNLLIKFAFSVEKIIFQLENSI
ncbi:DUF406 family protein [Shewanella sp. VB17]|uniref:DUF406 family protein n=1 Tax=Shewanella sp. VB17 TaxID=2739432 RepID=UPI0015652632|nr:DUF406 family protein [Shewanella sp. VB17]NRD73674.1 DUF406 family protein [Shewanella sp. VB17]